MTETAPERRARHRPSRSTEAQEAVKQLILDHKLSAGDPMPTEFELMDNLNMSRNSVREALKALQAVGIVDVRHGFGTFVGQLSLTGLVDELAFHSRIRLANGQSDLGSLVEIREVLECGLLRKVIDSHPDADRPELADVMATMAVEAERGEVLPETDKHFHECLYWPLGNPLIGQLLGAFWDVYYQLSEDLAAPSETSQDTLRKHRLIYRAVLDKDVDAAEQAMVRHFDGVRGRIRATWPGPSDERRDTKEPTSAHVT